MRYQGRNVYDVNGYPTVCWKEHPASPGRDYHAYVHRIVAYEAWGDKIVGHHVHHIDGDKWNWSADNLELVTPAEHIYKHKGYPVTLVCGVCDNTFVVNKSDSDTARYCSNPCRGRASERIDWPPTEVLVDMVAETNWSAVGRTLGVSDNAVRKRVKNHWRVADPARRLPVTETSM